MTAPGAIRRIGILISVAGLAACAGIPRAAPRPAPSVYPDTRFAVFSDPHFFDVSSSEPGAAFTRSLETYGELMSECREIFSETLIGLKKAAPSFVIVPGDLTRNGERTAHLLMAQSLAELEEAGIDVYVVPGNHDINNPNARRFSGDNAERVESVSPDDFSRIYGDFGYSEAFSRDPASLSYAAEPVEGLWIVGIDSCRYRENKDQSISGGKIQPATYSWLDEIFGEAACQGKAVIAFMHHGAVQHFARQDLYKGTMSLDGHEKFAEFLARRGVGMIFTGHGHAQDVALQRFGDVSYLYDIETGSLVQYPNAYRIVDIGADGRCAIQSRFITQTQGHPMDFTAYSERRLRKEVAGELVSILSRLGVGSEGARLIARQGEDAAVGFFRGDEPGHEPVVDKAGLDCWAGFIAGFLGQPLADVSTDLLPVDNDIVIRLDSGEWAMGE
jgi:hypothetical protein